jgi:hypothetical protein
MSMPGTQSGHVSNSPERALLSHKGSFAQRAFTQRSYIADADDSVKSDVPHVI